VTQDDGDDGDDGGGGGEHDGTDQRKNTRPGTNMQCRPYPQYGVANAITASNMLQKNAQHASKARTHPKPPQLAP
jgi:hypothetical protein